MGRRAERPVKESRAVMDDQLNRAVEKAVAAMRRGKTLEVAVRSALEGLFMQTKFVGAVRDLIRGRLQNRLSGDVVIARRLEAEKQQEMRSRELRAHFTRTFKFSAPASECEVTELGLSPGAVKALTKAGIDTLDDLQQEVSSASESEFALDTQSTFAQIRGIGEKYAREIAACLAVVDKLHGES